MSKIKFNYQLFDVTIIDNDIVLSNLNEEVTFENGYKAMRRLAETEYYSQPVHYIENTKLSDFISEWVDDNVEFWCGLNKSDYKTLTNYNN